MINFFAYRLAKLRKAKKIGQEEIAKKLDVTQKTVSVWESGKNSKPSFDDIDILGKLFNVDPYYLVGKDYETKMRINFELEKNGFLIDDKPTNLEKDYGGILYGSPHSEGLDYVELTTTNASNKKEYEKAAEKEYWEEQEQGNAYQTVLQHFYTGEYDNEINELYKNIENYKHEIEFYERLKKGESEQEAGLEYDLAKHIENEANFEKYLKSKENAILRLPQKSIDKILNTKPRPYNWKLKQKNVGMPRPTWDDEK